MPKFKMKKLVRDKCVQEMETGGITVKTKQLSDTEYLFQLQQKLVEEAQEVAHAKTNRESAQEMADVLEVLQTLATAIGYSWQQIEDLRIAKKAIKGGFEQKLFVEYTQSAEDNYGTAYCRAQPDKYPEIID